MTPLDIARVVLSGIIVVGFVTILGVYSLVTPGKSDLISGMIGVFGTGFMAVVYYWFPKSQ